jgi:hypothetical protein
VPNFIRIDGRYINLDHAHIDLDTKTLLRDPDTGAHKSVPCVRITLIGDVTGSDGDTRTKTYEYTGNQYEALKPWLERVLEALVIDGIDLPKPPKYAWKIVPPSWGIPPSSQELEEGDPF